MRHIATFAATAALALAPALVLAQTPEPQAGPAAIPSQTGQAAIPEQTIGKAGAALHDVAKLQQKYQGQMDAASPAQKKGISEQANAEAVQAIQSHGLSVQEYSNVVRIAQNDPQVKQRLLEAAKQGD
jgi:Domain of unknown function (DUF4168)